MSTPDPATTEWVPLWSPVVQGPAGPAFAADAKFWLSTPYAALTAHQNLGALASGYLKIATAAGVATPSSVASIPLADIPVSAGSRLLGRYASGAGGTQEITLGTGLSLSGAVLNASVSGLSGGAANNLAMWTSATTLAASGVTMSAAGGYMTVAGVISTGANAFNAQAITPGLYFIQTDGPVDAKTWRLIVSNQTMYIQMMNDAGAPQLSPFVLDRAGTTYLYGQPNRYAAQVIGGQTAGVSHGFIIYAGYNVNDVALSIQNRASSKQAMNVTGDMVVAFLNRMVIPVGADLWA